MTSLTEEDFLERYIAGERDFTEANFGFSDLSGYPNMREANLTLAYMDEIYLEKVDLTNAILKEVYLFQSCLSRAILRNADLSKAILNCCEMSGTDFTGAILIEAKMVEVLGYRADFTRANLTGADMTRARLKECIFNETIMPDGSIRTDV